MNKKNLLSGVFLLYSLIALGTGVLIEDEYDPIKVFLIGTVGVPGLTMWFLLWNWGQAIRQRFQTTFRVFTGMVFLSFLPGYLCLANALLADSDELKVLASGQETTSLQIAFRRGGFGLLFRHRF